jgi:class 3 adenylate cyclase
VKAAGRGKAVALLSALTMLLKSCAIGLPVPQLPADSLIFQSQGWIVWVVMLIYAVERLSPFLAASTGVLTTVVYFYLRFKIPQFQDVPYLQVFAQLLAANLTGMFIVTDHTRNARRQFKLEKELEAERSSSDKLLKNVLPIPIVGELKSQGSTVAHNYEDVTVLFADLVGFTKISSTMESKVLVKLLDELFSRFDALAEQHGIEKIKTIGDAYMAAAGCPESDPKHALRMTQYALDLDGVERGLHERHVEVTLEGDDVSLTTLGLRLAAVEHGYAELSDHRSRAPSARLMARSAAAMTSGMFLSMAG